MVFLNRMKGLLLPVIALFTALLGTAPANAEGEAGIISLRGQGHFYVGGETYEIAGNPAAGPLEHPVWQ